MMLINTTQLNIMDKDFERIRDVEILFLWDVA